MELVLIAGVAENNVIGIKGDLPWHIKEDLQRFKSLTTGHPVIVGKATFDSIKKRLGKPLPNRTNIVVSFEMFEAKDGELIFTSLESALAEAKKYEGEVFVIGGQSIYKQTINLADRLEITHVHMKVDGDAWFPEIDKSIWEEVQREDKSAEGIDYSFVTYKRKRKSKIVNGIKEFDPLISDLIEKEGERQASVLNMIPSENSASRAVREACASVLMNKYAEGYPFKRYYQGNKYVDEVETLAIERAKKLFGAEHVNVQPYSGSPANFAVFLAFLKPGETFMGLDLGCGGHLTHGSPVNFSGMTYRCVSYGVDRVTGLIDMNKVREIALREKPKLIISGLTAYPRQIDFQAFQKIAEEVGAIHLADISHIAGLIAAGVHPSPFPFTDVVSTTTHKTLRGPRGAIVMCKEKYAKQIDRAVFPGAQGGPHENVIAAKAVAFLEAMSADYRNYASQIVRNSKTLADTLIANEIKLFTGGTDNHLILIDLSGKGAGLGKSVAVALEEAGICCNANTIPYDPSTPFKPSGLRLGTPMITSRGMGESEMKLIGKWISDVIKEPDNSILKEAIRKEVEGLCKKFPVDR